MIAFIIWTLFTLFSELALKVLVFNTSLNLEVIYIVILSLVIGGFLTIITRVFNKKLNRIFSYIILVISSFIYGAQYIYFMIYNSPFSFYSLTQGGTNQALDAIGQVVKTILEHPQLILFFVPLLIYICLDIFKVIDYTKLKIKKVCLFLAIVILSLLLLFTLIILGKKSKSKSYEILTNSNNPILITNHFGINMEMLWDLNVIVLRTIKPSPYVIPEIASYSNLENADYNIIEIDFDNLIKNETDKTVIDMHNYFKSVQPTSKNEQTGRFKGKNLILVLAESFSDIAISKELTPTLYKMQNEGISFTNFYTPLYPVSTIDGEYMTATGLIPKAGVWSIKYAKDNYLPFTLASMLKSQEGYHTLAYHNHTGDYYSRYNSIPNLGYESFKTCLDGLNINCDIWPESDVEMIEDTTKDYINSSSPFLAYYLTVSGHLQYNLKNAMASKNWDEVKDLDYSNSVKAYLACQIELDRAIEKLVEELDKAGIAEDTIIAINCDHYPYGLTLNEINEISKEPRDKVFEVNRGAFIIWHKGIKHMEVEKLACNMDIVPTLANMYGLKYDSRLLMGRDIFSNYDPIIILGDKSWISEYGKYNAITGKFIGNNNSVDKKYIDNINSIVTNRFNMSTLILDKDYYRKVLDEK